MPHEKLLERVNFLCRDESRAATVSATLRFEMEAASNEFDTLLEAGRWTGVGAAAGAFAGAAVQAADLAVASLSLSAWESATVAVLAAMLGALPGGLIGLSLFSARRLVGWSTDGGARRRLAASVRIGGFVFFFGAMLAIANGSALQFGNLVQFTRWMIYGIALTTSVAAVLAWRSVAESKSRLLKPTGTGDAVGALLAIGVASATSFSTVSAWAAVLGGCLLGAAALFAATRFPRLVTTASALGLLVVSAAAITPPRSHALPETVRPAPRSVVLIVLDTQRADHLGPYGGLAGATPTVDQLAAEGTVFDDVISPSPWTIPSHASMFTGLYPRQHGCWFGDRRWLPDELETVAERLRAEQFETVAMISNGYLKFANVLQGFDTQLEAFGDLEKLKLAKIMRYTGIGFPRWIDRGGAETSEMLVAWFRQRDPDRPFFLFINLFEAHSLYLPPIADRELPAGANEWDVVNATRRFEDTRWHSMNRDVGKHEDVIRSLYRAEVRYQDRVLGRIFEVLDANVDPADVAVVLTADHGENLGDGGRWGHLFALNDALVNVPLVIRAPGRLEAGARRTGPFSTLDLAPTLLELAGLPAQLGEGRSLLAESLEPRAAAFSEVYPNYPLIGRGRIAVRDSLAEFQWPLTAIRTGNRRLLVPQRGPAQLYDLSSDPREERDLAAERPHEVEALRAELEAWRLAHPRAETSGDGSSEVIDDETREQLESLGYM